MPADHPARTDYAEALAAKDRVVELALAWCSRCERAEAALARALARLEQVEASERALAATLAREIVTRKAWVAARVIDVRSEEI